jgi:hypothetical protein
LKRKLKSYPEEPKGIEKLWERVQEQWDNIDNSECQKLIECMPRRVEAVMRARGGYTKYWNIIVWCSRMTLKKLAQ